MKRVRCPKCDNYIIFDETKYEEGQQLVFQCTECNKQFGIRIGVSKLHNRQKDENPDEQANEEGCGSIVIIENCFHYKHRNKRGQLQYVLRDLNSNTGTFVDNVELQQGERRIIEDGSLFTLGATSIILRGADSED